MRYFMSCFVHRLVANWLFAIFACEHLAPGIPCMFMWLFDHREDVLKPFNQFFYAQRYRPRIVRRS